MINRKNSRPQARRFSLTFVKSDHFFLVVLVLGMAHQVFQPSLCYSPYTLFSFTFDRQYGSDLSICQNHEVLAILASLSRQLVASETR